MSDLTKEEQEHVREALRFLEVRSGGRVVLAKAMRCQPDSLRHVIAGRSSISASKALRVARLAGVAFDDVVTGHYPVSGTCPYCGRGPG